MMRHAATEAEADAVIEHTEEVHTIGDERAQEQHTNVTWTCFEMVISPAGSSSSLLVFGSLVVRGGLASLYLAVWVLAVDEAHTDDSDRFEEVNEDALPRTEEMAVVLANRANGEQSIPTMSNMAGDLILMVSSMVNMVSRTSGARPVPRRGQAEIARLLADLTARVNSLRAAVRSVDDLPQISTADVPVCASDNVVFVGNSRIASITPAPTTSDSLAPTSMERARVCAVLRPGRIEGPRRRMPLSGITDRHQTAFTYVDVFYLLAAALIPVHIPPQYRFGSWRQDSSYRIHHLNLVPPRADRHRTRANRRIGLYRR